LRRDARQDSEGALRAVAEQFEALFLQMMLKSMRQASFGDPMFGSNEGDMYREMFDQQIALTMSRRRGLGLADVIERQLSRDGVKVSPGEGAELAPSRPLRIPPPSLVVPPVAGGIDGGSVTPKATQDVGSSSEVRTSAVESFSGPQEFVARLWPAARSAAARLHTQPAVLLAQAALETGWGQAIIKGQHGESSHNLFNIKADSRWGGARVAVPTLEYEDGIAVRRHEPFRVYDSFEASFDDYVNLLQGSPRYAAALERAADPQAFVKALHEAGYATDPDYSGKVLRVLDGLVTHLDAAGLGPGVASLKGSTNRDAMPNERSERG
jgi:flagellar protein FlgJ